MTTLAPEHPDLEDDRPIGHEDAHDEACRWADQGRGEE